MENIDELSREAEEAKERINRDFEEVREILRGIAGEADETGRTRIEETMQRLEKQIEKAMTIMTKPPIVKSSIGAGNGVTKEMDFSDFTNIEVGYACKVEIIRSDSYRVTITSSKKLFDYIDVAKSGNTLKISLKPLHSRFQLRPTLEARIDMPALNKLRLAGAVRGIVRGFSSQEGFDLNLSGASRLDIDMETGEAKLEVSGASRLNGNMKAGDAEFTLSGASRAALNGLANNAVLSAWGASRLDLSDFALNDASIHLKGASRAAIHVNGKLDLDLSGASRLYYIGNPTLRDTNVSGASRLSHR